MQEESSVIITCQKLLSDEMNMVCLEFGSTGERIVLVTRHFSNTVVDMSKTRFIISSLYYRSVSAHWAPLSSLGPGAQSTLAGV